MAQKTFDLKISKNTRVIKNNKKALVYNAFFGNAMICHIDMATLIEDISREKSILKLKSLYNQPDLENAISELIKNGFIVEKNFLETNQAYANFPNKKMENGSLINKLRLNVSLACNMECDYCYVDEKDFPLNDVQMTWDIAKKSINNFFTLLRQHDHKFCIIRFFGGEPLLNWPVINRTLDLIQIKKQDISVHFILNTNGTIYSQKIANILAKHKVGIAISLDGSQKEHNRFRHFKSGKSTYKIITQNIESFLNTGCTLGIETTIGDHNIFGLQALIDQIDLWNTTYKSCIPISFQHLAIVNKTNLDTIPVNQKIKQLIALIEYARQKNVKADTGMVHFSINALKGQRNMGRYCRAMGGELCVYPNGDIYPCAALKIKLGTISDLTAVFKSAAYHTLANRTAGNIPACKGCKIEAFCAGGCAADAFAANTSANTPMTNCDLERNFFKALVKNEILTSVNLS
jgi:uncharacterized protein